MNKPTFFLTAYGIARKHGFQGSEEEWLNSLTAFYLAQQAGYTGTMEEWLQLLNDPVPAFSIGIVTTLPGGSDATVSVGGTRRKPVLNFGIPRGLGIVDALPLVGGLMRGSVDMNGFSLHGLPSPSDASDAVPKEYLDEIVKYILEAVNAAANAASTAQSTANGAVTAAGNAASAAAAAAGASVAAQETANSKALKVPFTAQLTASGWTGDTAPYTQTVALEGIMEEDDPYYGPVYSGDISQRIQERTAFGCIDDLDTSENSVTFTCFENKPVTDLTVQMEVFR